MTPGPDRRDAAVVAELKISDAARRAELRRALRGGGKAKVSLTAGQRSALLKLGLTPAGAGHVDVAADPTPRDPDPTATL